MEALSQQMHDPPLSSSSGAAGCSPIELRLVSDHTAGSLRMFGAAPSPYLRQAQADFAEALAQLVALANQHRDLSRANKSWEAVL